VQQNKARLLAIEHEKDFLLSKLVDMEIKSTKLLSQASNFSNRQRALQYELLTFKGESIELKIRAKKREKDDEIQKILEAEQAKSKNSHIPLISNYKKQLADQSKFYESNIQQQHNTLEKTSRLKDQLQVDCEKLTATQLGLDELVIEKNRILDDQDVQISRLQEVLRDVQQQNTPSAPKKYEPMKTETKEEKERMKKLFEQKETQWTDHTHKQEDGFDELLENFDTLTHTAMDFDSKRMRYDRQIEELNQQVDKLEIELIEEKVNKIGYNGQQQAPPTTASLRKEFRSLVADLKKTHQLRMDREAEEIRKLHEQLEELQKGEGKRKKGYSMAIQTDF
jgi:hypothetical protein